MPQRRWSDDDEPALTAKEQFQEEWIRWQSAMRWRVVLTQVEEEGLHLSPERLQKLVRKWGVPSFAGAYVAARWSGEISPSGHPALPPLDPQFPEWLPYHFDVGRVPWPGIASNNSGIPTRFLAVEVLNERYRRYARFETGQEPNARNKHPTGPLKYRKTRRVWTIVAPKKYALRKVAEKLPSPIKEEDSLSVATLEVWERKVRAWRRRFIPSE